jgi:hypothetical protein
MRYANVGDYLHRHQAMPRYEVLPSELLGHIPGTGKAYLQMIQLIFEQSINHFHLLQNFD